jgi:hypothetical protein
MSCCKQPRITRPSQVCTPFPPVDLTVCGGIVPLAAAHNAGWGVRAPEWAQGAAWLRQTAPKVPACEGSRASSAEWVTVALYDVV